MPPPNVSDAAINAISAAVNVLLPPANYEGSGLGKHGEIRDGFGEWGRSLPSAEPEVVQCSTITGMLPPPRLGWAPATTLSGSWRA